MLAWHEDDRFWAILEPQLASEASRKAAAEEAAAAVKLLGTGSGAEILDHCCGIGRHSVELARLGFRVTGVDRTARYLDVARAEAAARGVAIEFVQEDARTFHRAKAFDGVVNLFTSFGYFDDPEDDLRVLRNLHGSLRPGGRLVMEMAGKEWLARVYAPKDWQQYPDGTFFLAEREVMPGWSLVRNRWIAISPNGERVEFNFTHRIFSGAELEALVAKAGFKPLALHGALDGRPYDRNAIRLVIVAEA
jgi:SAM-dependent methyltransferase